MPQSTSEKEKVVVEQHNSDSEISIIEIIEMMMRRWWLIAIFAVVAAAGATIYTKLTTVPTYTSTGVLYINTQQQQLDGDVNTTALQGAQKLMPTYIEILKSKSFLQNVSQNTDSKYTYEEINSMTTIKSTEDTNLLRISVVANDSHDAFIICNSILNSSTNEILRVFEGGSVKIIDAPEEAAVPSKPSLAKRALIGFAAGIILAMLIIFLIELFDSKVKSADELSARYNIPVLGSAPNLHDNL